jgi:hypothetical protein
MAPRSLDQANRGGMALNREHGNGITAAVRNTRPQSKLFGCPSARDDSDPLGPSPAQASNQLTAMQIASNSDGI